MFHERLTLGLPVPINGDHSLLPRLNVAAGRKERSGRLQARVPASLKGGRTWNAILRDNGVTEKPGAQATPAEGRTHPAEHRGLPGAPTEKEKEDSTASFSPRAFRGEQSAERAGTVSPLGLHRSQASHPKRWAPPWPRPPLPCEEAARSPSWGSWGGQGSGIVYGPSVLVTRPGLGAQPP